MIAAALAWKTVPRYPGAATPSTGLPVRTQARARSVERQFRKLSSRTPISSPRMHALMCLADQSAVAAGGPTLSGLEWGYFGWVPVPVGAEPQATSRLAGIRERLRVRRIVRAVSLEYAHLSIEDLVSAACQAFDELRLMKHHTSRRERDRSPSA